jgi:hypothetical protein
MWLWDVEDPTFSTQSAHRWRWGFQDYAPSAVCSSERYLLLIYVRGWVDPKATVQLERLGQLKRFNDIVRNRTRDVPACSIVPLPTALPRAPKQKLRRIQLKNRTVCMPVNERAVQCEEWYSSRPDSNAGISGCVDKFKMEICFHVELVILFLFTSTRQSQLAQRISMSTWLQNWYWH